MKSWKSPGSYQIQAKFLKLLNKGKTKEITRILYNINTSGEIPAEWLTSELIIIYKKAGTKIYNDAKTIILMNYLMKVFTWEYIYRLFEPILGFLNAVGTGETLFKCCSWDAEILVLIYLLAELIIGKRFLIMEKREL